nr:TRAP transporter substrate-binding protein [Herbaspirillum sp.]
MVLPPTKPPRCNLSGSPRIEAIDIQLKKETIMTGMTRRSALKLSLGAAIAFPSILTTTRVFGADFTLKYANNCPETHPLTIRTREAAAAIKAETNGKIDLQVFPNSQLGGDTDMLAQLRAGGIDFFTLSPLILSTLVPKAAVSGIGFAWSGYDRLWPAMDGKLGEFVRAEIRKSGLYPFEKIFDNGFRQISTSGKPIKTPEDLAGLKIRVPPSSLWTSMFKAFDAAPLSINFSEVYSSLQTRIADAQENPLVTFESAKLYEVQKFVSKTNHMWDGFWFLAGGKTWNKLPADVQKIIEKHMAAAAQKEREDVQRLNASLEKDIAAKGIIFNSVDPAAFQAKLKSKGFYKEWQAKFGADLWKLLETSSGLPE